MLRLEIVEAPPNGSRVGDTFVVGPGGAVVGRTDKCDWQLLDPENLISRQHLSLHFQNGGYVIEDQSTNGSFLNDSAQPIGRGNTASIGNGDRIRIGAYSIKATMPESVVAPSVDLGPAPGAARAAASMPSAPPPAVSTADQAFADVEARPLSTDFLGAPPPAASRPSRDAPSLLDGGAPRTLGVPVSNRHATDDLLGAPPPGAAGAHTTPGGLAVPVAPGQGGTAAPAQPVPPSPTSGGAGQPIPDDWFLDDDDLLGPAPITPDTPSASPPPPPVADIPEIPEIPEITPSPQVARPALQDAPPGSPAVPVAPQAAPAASPALADGLRAALAPVLGERARLASEQELLLATNEVAELLAIAIPQLIAALRSRTQFKESLRLRQTLIRASENNPLKMPDADSRALQRIVLNQETGMQHGRAAVSEAFEELARHQAGLLAALRPALKALLESLSPDAVEGSLGGEKGRLPITGRRGKLWETYCEMHARLMQGDGSNAEQRFLMSLADQYTQVVEQLD
jgi:type VI secretion system FHA domain protein